MKPRIPQSSALKSLSATSSVPDQVSVELIEIAESASLGDAILRKLRDPGWLVSLAFHLLVLLALALWMLPTIKKQTLVMLGESTPSETLDLLDIEPMEIVAFEPSAVETSELVENDFPEPEVEELEVAELNEAAPDMMDADTMDAMTEIASESLTGMADGELGAAVAGIQQKVVRAGGQNGEVQFTLIWHSVTDLDLHVFTPRGERISYQRKISRCTGELDVDANAGKQIENPVENIRWLKGRPRTGRYTVMVHLFKHRDEEPKIPYQMLAKTGEEVSVVEKKISHRDYLQVYRFVYFAPDITEAARPRMMQDLKRLQAKEETAAQKMFNEIPRRRRSDRTLRPIVERYPHTDAAIEALRLMSGIRK